MAEMTKTQDYATAVHMLTPRWVASYGNVMTGLNVATVMIRPQGYLEVAFKVARGDGVVVAGALPCRAGAPQVEGDQIHGWGLRRLGSGVWMLAPSIVVQGTLHAFMVLTGVPDPAPWAPIAGPWRSWESTDVRLEASGGRVAEVDGARWRAEVPEWHEASDPVEARRLADEALRAAGWELQP